MVSFILGEWGFGPRRATVRMIPANLTADSRENPAGDMTTGADSRAASTDFRVYSLRRPAQSAGRSSSTARIPRLFAPIDVLHPARNVVRSVTTLPLPVAFSASPTVSQDNVPLVLDG
jgi:hypothetical protein